MIKRTETYSRICKNASMTLEAAVVFPLFVGFLVFLMFYFRVMQVQIGMEQAVAYTARMTAASTKEVEEKVQIQKVKLFLNRRIRKEKIPLQYIDQGIHGISLANSEFDKTQICIHVRYKMTFPIGFFGKLTYQAEQEVSARKWIGRVQEREYGEDENAFVYVTESGNAYHQKKSCAYLDLSIHVAAANVLNDLRNKNGGIYKACSLCCKKKRSFYYITNYGRYYHTNVGCRGLKRTIFIIPVKDIGKRHSCSKCAGE
ncbi:MAG: pilus assembly protein [Lachnospiraceae bacterium]|nr:pilus assembly protein [Lachnospiraceae bacterium]